MHECPVVCALCPTLLLLKRQQSAPPPRKAHFNVITPLKTLSPSTATSCGAGVQTSAHEFEGANGASFSPQHIVQISLQSACSQVEKKQVTKVRDGKWRLAW